MALRSCRAPSRELRWFGVPPAAGLVVRVVLAVLAPLRRTRPSGRARVALILDHRRPRAGRPCVSRRWSTDLMLPTYRASSPIDLAEAERLVLGLDDDLVAVVVLDEPDRTGLQGPDAGGLVEPEVLGLQVPLAVDRLAAARRCSAAGCARSRERACAHRRASPGRNWPAPKKMSLAGRERLCGDRTAQLGRLVVGVDRDIAEVAAERRLHPAADAGRQRAAAAAARLDLRAAARRTASPPAMPTSAPPAGAAERCTPWLARRRCARARRARPSAACAITESATRSASASAGSNAWPTVRVRAHVRRRSHQLRPATGLRCRFFSACVGPATRYPPCATLGISAVIWV